MKSCSDKELVLRIRYGSLQKLFKNWVWDDRNFLTEEEKQVLADYRSLRSIQELEGLRRWLRGGGMDYEL